MAVRPILVLPDARLRAVADPIVEVDAEIKTLAKDMLDTMYDAPGIGLAAPQIGVMKRIVVMDVVDEGEAPDPLVMINPEITHFGDADAGYRGGMPVHPRALLRGRAPQ